VGVFSNRWMVVAVLTSLMLLLGVIYLPFLQPIFNTVPLGWLEWEIVLPLLLVPAVVAELTKFISTRRMAQATAQR
jgi:Ca2+-transporting ATPase